MKAELIESHAALQALEPEWWELFSRVPAAPPFVSPAWLLPWWRSFSPGKLHSVAVRQGGRLVGFAPLYIEIGEAHRLLPLGIGISDYLDVLLDPSCAAEAGAALLAAILETSEQWGVWRAEEAPPGAAVLGLGDAPDCLSAVQPQSACPVLDLRDGGPVPPRQRRKLAMARHRTARRGGMLEHATAATCEDLLAELFRLHEARWAERGEPGVLADPIVRRFHVEAVPALLAAGLLRLTALRIESQVAGVYYGFWRGPDAYAYLGGFDPAFAFESPGTVLLGAAFDDAVSDGASLFHFLRGGEAYKYRWGARDRWNSCRTFRRIASSPTEANPALAAAGTP